MKSGMSIDGKAITGLPYLKQRIKDVIETPKGSLVGARSFGSDFYLLQDKNITPAFYMSAYIELADAISSEANGLDDFKLQTMSIDEIVNNSVKITISGYLDSANDVVNFFDFYR
jgi:hypothetical protein